jgi:hypothetical protein
MQSFLLSGNLGKLLPAQGGAEWEIVTPVSLTLHAADEGGYLITDEDFALEGMGPTPIAAVQNYAAALLTYYREIEASARHNPDDLVELTNLQLYLRRVTEEPR